MYPSDHVLRDDVKTSLTRSQQTSWLKRILLKLWQALQSLAGKQPAEIETDSTWLMTHVQQTARTSQQHTLSIELFLSEEATFNAPPDGCFECSEDQIVKVIAGELSTIVGVFANAHMIRCTRTRAGTQYFARFSYRGEGFWYMVTPAFASPKNVGATCWPATLTLDTEPLDTFYEFDAT